MGTRTCSAMLVVMTCEFTSYKNRNDEITIINHLLYSGHPFLCTL